MQNKRTTFCKVLIEESVVGAWCLNYSGSLSDAAPQCYNDSAHCVTVLWDEKFSLMQSTERLVSVMTGTRERCIRLKGEGDTVKRHETWGK